MGDRFVKSDQVGVVSVNGEPLLHAILAPWNRKCGGIVALSISSLSISFCLLGQLGCHAACDP